MNVEEHFLMSRCMVIKRPWGPKAVIDS